MSNPIGVTRVRMYTVRQLKRLLPHDGDELIWRLCNELPRVATNYNDIVAQLNLLGYELKGNTWDKH
jgi:hypothetical protein